MKIFSIDASTKRTGYAMYDTETKEVKYGVVASASIDVEKRICVMRDNLKDLIEDFEPNVVVIEDVRPDGGNAHTGKVLTWLQGIIAVTVYEINKKIKFEMLGASSWRSKIGLQGYRITREKQKELDIAYANKQFGLTLGTNNDDEADALCILAAYLNGANAEVPTHAKATFDTNEPSAF